LSARLGRDPPNRHSLRKNQELGHKKDDNGDHGNGLHSIPPLQSGQRLGGTAQWAFIPRFVLFVN